MRTVHDLREALASLEDQAPAVEHLLVKSGRASQPVQPRRRTWLLPIAAAGVTIAIMAVIVGVLQRASHGQATGDRTTTNSPAADGGDARLLPFRLTGPLPQLTLLDAHSAASRSKSYGSAVLAEYGMEVTIDVSTAKGQSAQSASASQVDVSGVKAWIDTTCSVRAAPTSSIPSGGDANDSSTATFNPSCALTYDTGPWHVAIYVAGPGGGSRDVTPQQFLEIGDRLQLAVSTNDSGTWFDTDGLLPS